MSEKMFEGSCLCGQIAYQVSCEPQTFGHCHCRTCRKAHSAAFSTVMSVPKEHFQWSRGEAGLTGFESSPGKVRYFCKDCGSQLVAIRPETDYVLIRVGSIDTELTNVQAATSGARTVHLGTTLAKRSLCCPRVWDNVLHTIDRPTKVAAAQFRATRQSAVASSTSTKWGRVWHR